jgi:hypothetical protein
MTGAVMNGVDDLRVLSIPCRYLQGIDNAAIIGTVHARCAPMISASNGLRTIP